jgi:hypothetical protein
VKILRYIFEEVPSHESKTPYILALIFMLTGMLAWMGVGMFLVNTFCRVVFHWQPKW